MRIWRSGKVDFEEVVEGSETTSDESTLDHASSQNVLGDQITLTCPTGVKYLEALFLDNSVCVSKHILLPLDETPALSFEQCRDLKAWAASVNRRKMANGLCDIHVADLLYVPFSCCCVSSSGRSLLRAVVYDLRQKLEEVNVSNIRRGQCWHSAQSMVLKLQPNNFTETEEKSLLKLGVSLDGLCRAVAEYDDVVGVGGWRWLQRARRALRDWLDNDENSSRAFNSTEALHQVDQRLGAGLAKKVRRRLCIMAVASHQAVFTDVAREACGKRGEDNLMLHMQNAGISRESYHTEEDLRQIQLQMFGKMCFPTPDIVLRIPLFVNGGSRVHWIDSKGTCVVPGLGIKNIENKLRRQLARFVELFGPGLVIWQSGFASAITDGIPGVRAATWTMTRDSESCCSPLEPRDGCTAILSHARCSPNSEVSHQSVLEGLGRWQ